MIELALHERLMASAAVADAVRYTDAGGTLRHGIYPQKAPQGKPPHRTDPTPRITYQRVSTNRLHHLGGPSGLTGPRIQVDVWALTYDRAKRLADAVRLALDGERGLAASSGLRVQCWMVGEDQDLYEEPVHDDDDGMHRVSMDVTVYFDEAIVRRE